MNTLNREKNLKFRGLSSSSGFTLIELLIVIVIIGFITGVFAFSLKVLPGMKMKQSGRRFASIIKFVAATARTSHLPHRLILDLDTKDPTLQIEFLPPGNILTSINPEVKTKEELEEEDDEFSDWPRFDPANPIGPLGTEDTGKPFKPALPAWTAHKSAKSDKLKLEALRITKVSFPCLNKDFYEGKVALIFFPDGSNPGAVITLEGADKNVSTVIVEPGLSRVKIRSGDIEPDNICYDALGTEIRRDEEEK